MTFDSMWELKCKALVCDHLMVGVWVGCDLFGLWL